jgi:hypothetical protein
MGRTRIAVAELLQYAMCVAAIVLVLLRLGGA